MDISAIDFNSLAALRPGEARENLARLLGIRWREPPPHRQGQVKVLSHRFGFEAQIDTSGHIGALQYHDPFPKTVSFFGLNIDMPVEAALAAMPQLSLSFRTPVYRSVYYAADVSSRYKMVVEFRWGKLYGISFRDPQAVYPAKQPMAYPAPEGAVGAPFGDPNFKLAVMSSLLEDDALDLADPSDLAAFALKRPVNLEKEGYQLSHEAYDYLIRYPLTGADLASVESITFDGGNEIYPYCFRFWDGETSEFDVKSISGIELCPNIRRLLYIALIDQLDVADIVSLRKIEEIDLPSKCINPERLLELPALKKLSFRKPTIGSAVLLDKLRARSVQLRICD
jgi:hypothetical protein